MQQVSSGFGSSTFRCQLDENRVGSMFDTLRRTNTYAANRGPGIFPLNFFVANPWANQANIVDNSSWSTFHAFEFEVGRRFGRLSFKANYTFSKLLTHAPFLTIQNDTQLYPPPSTPLFPP